MRQLIDLIKKNIYNRFVLNKISLNVKEGMKKIMYNNWDELEQSIRQCKNCKLCQNNKALGMGNKEAKIFVINDVSENEGTRVDKIKNVAFDGVGFKQEELYYTSLIKCISNTNIQNVKSEIQTCLNFLRNEFLLIKPKLVLLMGNSVLKNICGEEHDLFAERGQWIEKRGILYMPTWNPKDLIKDEDKKIEFWLDLKNVLEKYKQLNEGK